MPIAHLPRCPFHFFHTVLMLGALCHNLLQLLKSSRAWNIALRTAHIASMGMLLGGHAFDVPRDDLLVCLSLTIASGAGLGVLEAGPGLLWFHQGRGLATLLKLGLLLTVPFLWGHWHARLTVLLVVVAVASVGSHMPARFRYYSVIYKKVIPAGCGPGAAAADDEPADRPAVTSKHE